MERDEDYKAELIEFMKRHYGSEVQKVENMRKMMEKDVELEESLGILCISFTEKYNADNRQKDNVLSVLKEINQNNNSRQEVSNNQQMNIMIID